ncbi:MAG TPA: dihydroneopterin aldolase [Nitrospirota bacterium]|nr:dihydroneopterin aldolase [Nitrospirota bacterium]
MDRILIGDLLVRCIIGVGEEERRERQDVVINLSLATDLSRAGRSDNFNDAVDYRDLKKQIVNMAEQSTYHLVEALAEAVADMCLVHPAISQVQVRVDKPGALRFARSVGVEITRDQRKKEP